VWKNGHIIGPKGYLEIETVRKATQAMAELHKSDRLSLGVSAENVAKHLDVRRYHEPEPLPFDYADLFGLRNP
jgi:hypothetical protein